MVTKNAATVKHESSCKDVVCKFTLSVINIREYRRGSQKWTIQRNRQHKVHETKKNKTKTQHNMCWTPLFATNHKYLDNVNKTCAPYKQLEVKTNQNNK